MNDTHDTLEPLLSAYLDGELDDPARELFEEHYRICDCCAAELLRQRQLLCELDVALNETQAMTLPLNFAEVIAVHAESHMGGMRDGAERRQALSLSLILASASFALIGAASGEMVWGPARTLISRLQGIFNFIWDAVYQASTGLTIIFRMLTRSFVFESRLLGLFILLLFVTAIALLPRFIALYHRAQIVE